MKSIWIVPVLVSILILGAFTIGYSFDDAFALPKVVSLSESLVLDDGVIEPTKVDSLSESLVLDDGVIEPTKVVSLSEISH